MFGPHAAVSAAQFPGFDVALVVVEVDVLSVADEVVTVAPVPSEVDVVVLVVVVVELEVLGFMPSQSLLILTSAQFQNCSAARVTSTG